MGVTEQSIDQYVSRHPGNMKDNVPFMSTDLPTSQPDILICLQKYYLAIVIKRRQMHQ